MRAVLARRRNCGSGKWQQLAVSPANGIISGINVTPLVDVMLVLLVIFIVTAKIIVTPAVPLDLPRAAHGEEVQVILSVILPVRGRCWSTGPPCRATTRSRTRHTRRWPAIQSCEL